MYFTLRPSTSRNLLFTVLPVGCRFTQQLGEALLCDVTLSCCGMLADLLLTSNVQTT